MIRKINEHGSNESHGFPNRGNGWFNYEPRVDFAEAKQGKI